MLLVLRGLWHQYRPARRNETEHEFMTRRYPHLCPPLPWSDGTD